MQVLQHASTVASSYPAAIDPLTVTGASTVTFLEGLLERLSSGGERRKVKIAKVC